MMEELREITLQAKSRGLMTVVWSYPRGGKVTKAGETGLDIIAYAAHMAALLGATIIKVKLPSDHIDLAEAKSTYEKNDIATTSAADRVRHIMQASFAGKRIVVFSGGAAKNTDELLDEVRAIRNGMEAAAVPVEFSKGEWGCGQEEINLRYAEPVEMADRHTLYKHGVKEIAHAQGSSITFMAKYDMGAAGSSFHLHSSLWDRTGKKSLFYEKGKRYGSARYGHWLAGQMAMAKEFAYFYAPYVNSYKRYQAGSFAPTRIVAGWDNRTCGFRICGEGSSFRVENRIPGADANPYLAFAATIAAGLHGIQKKLPAPRVYEGNAYEDAARKYVQSVDDLVKAQQREREFADEDAKLRERRRRVEEDSLASEERLRKLREEGMQAQIEEVDKQTKKLKEIYTEIEGMPAAMRRAGANWIAGARSN